MLYHFCLLCCLHIFGLVVSKKVQSLSLVWLVSKVFKFLFKPVVPKYVHVIVTVHFNLRLFIIHQICVCLSAHSHLLIFKDLVAFLSHTSWQHL